MSLDFRVNLDALLLFDDRNPAFCPTSDNKGKYVNLKYHNVVRLAKFRLVSVLTNLVHDLFDLTIIPGICEKCMQFL